MSKHTPTPWFTQKCGPGCPDDVMIAADRGFTAEGIKKISTVGKALSLRQTAETTEANAAFIVRAVNAHDDLVEALRSLRRCVIDAKGGFEVNDLKAQMALRLANTALAKHGGAA